MGSKISEIGIYLPERTLTNDALAAQFSRWDPTKIENKVGIRKRHIAGPEETAGDMAFQAADLVLRDLDRTRIDMLILCTQSPDYFLPTTACILQERLKLRIDIGAFDFNLGCSGFIYGLAMAKSFINSNIASNILLITSETYSKYINSLDLANRTIFGDGAAATIIEGSVKEKIGEFVLGTNGKGMNNLIVPNGCSRHEFEIDPEKKSTEAGDIFNNNNLYMNGPEIFSFTIDVVPEALKRCLEKNHLNIKEVDYFIFHQANKYIIDYLRKYLEIPKEKFYSDILETGNTVSSTIPIGLRNSIEKGIVSEGDKVLLCGFGVGYSWGAVVIEI